MQQEDPWYEAVASDDIQQGDILFACPVVELTLEDFKPNPPPKKGQRYDTIILTQSCDLVHGREKVKSVLVAAHWPLTVACQVDTTLIDPNEKEKARTGGRPNYCMLAGSLLPEFQPAMAEIRLVNFAYLYTLPVPLMRQLVQEQHRIPRPRLKAPYREYLSQAFARYFMRVGLPSEGEIPQFKSKKGKAKAKQGDD